MPYRRNNYDFVIDSSFTPFTMQEMLVPFMAYKDAFEKSEEAYVDLSTRADKFKYLASSLDPESKAAKIYNGYANDLKAQAEDLAHNGLSMGNRSALTDLKRRYQGEIGRLEQVDAIRKAQIKEQNALRLQDPTRLFSRRADLTSFDEYLDNPDLSYESYSGALLSQQVGTAAAAIAKSLRDYGKGKPLDGFTKTWLQQHGYTAAEVAVAINDPTNPKSSSVLNSLVDNVVKGSNIASWGDANALSQAYNYARQGLWQAVGQTQVGTYTDEAAKIAAQEASSKRVAQYAAGLTATQNINHTMLTPRALRSQKEIDETTKKIDHYVQQGWMKKDSAGNWVMTDDGMKEYIRNNNPSVSVTGSTGATSRLMNAETKLDMETSKNRKYAPTQFRQFLDGLNNGNSLIDGMLKNPFRARRNAGKLFTQAVENNKSDAYDMYRSTEYIRHLDDSYSKAVKDQVFAEGNVLEKLDFNGKDGFVGERIKNSELAKFKPVRINYSKYGNTITWTNDDGETVRTNAPKAVNERVSNTVQQAMNNESLLAEIIRVGKVPKADKNGNPVIKDGAIQFTNTPLSQQEIMAYYNDWQEEMDIVQSVGSMYVTPSSTKKIEYNPYEFGLGLQNNFGLGEDE